MSKAFVLFAFLVLFLTEIVAQPVASFNVNYTEVCAPANIVCTNTTTNCTGAITHYWSIIGSPDVSSNQDAVFFFPSGGTYTIILQEACAEGTDTYEMVITVFDEPTANFDNTVMTGCAPYTAYFNDLSVAGDGNITDWTWYFNDGFSSTEQNPVHSYNIGGIYNITLIIEDENGCASDITVNNLVRVANDPVVSFVADNPTMCIAPHTVNFTSNVMTSFGLNATYAWDFGDGSPISGLPNPSHQYSTGVYDVTLTVTDEYGCQSILVKNDYIQVAPTTPEYSVLEGDVICRGSQTHFVNETNYPCLWNFGDGGTSTQNNPVHVYNTNGVVTVTLTLDPGGQCESQTTFDLTVESVTASFTTSPTNLFSCSTPFTVNFTNTSSPNATEFFYVFQDGGSSTSENPSHTYNFPGTFQPTLTVVSDAGCMHTFMGPVITIENPSATFVGDVLEGCSPLTVDFNYTGGSAVSNYNWNFGNGQTEPNGTSSESSVYTSGDYIVTLTVTDNNGCTASQSVEVNVGDFITFPTDVFDNDSDHTPLPDHFLCAQDTISFYIPNWANEDYEFSWWVDSTINLAINHEFVEYTFDYDTGFVYLHLLTNNNGCVDTTLKEVFYISGPIIHDISSMSDCLSPRDYQFELNATLADYWDWEIFYYPNPATQTLIESNLNSIDEIFPFTFPPTPDSFWVKVTAYSDTIGCVFVDSVQINIGLPSADFGIDNFDVCANVEIEFNGSGSQNATEYYWDFGDGTTSGWVNNSIVNHAFNNAGTFEVLLIVRNSNGCLDSVIHQIHIIGPEIHVDFSDTFVYVDETITFVDNSVSNEVITSTHWVFGDGYNQSGTTVNHEYSQPGTYSVTIYVETVSGCMGEETYPDAITVVAEPSIYFTIFPASGPTNADGYVEINIVGGVPPFDVNCSSAKSEYDIDNLAPGNYVLSVEDANGHTASVQFEMTWTTGIIPIEFTDSLYPNPASEFIIIQSTNSLLTSLEILNLNGKILLRKDFLSDNEVVDVTSLENGIYLVRTYNEGYSKITKLLICR